MFGRLGGLNSFSTYDEFIKTDPKSGTIGVSACMWVDRQTDRKMDRNRNRNIFWCPGRKGTGRMRQGYCRQDHTQA
jgi:hypothetical protein